ncbi:MAG: hypothetical protein QXZ54_01595 [Candidatus Methanomethylicia archaeon]
MNRILKAFIRALISFVVRVGIPLGLLYLLPPDLISLLNSFIDFKGFIYNIAFIGVIVVILTFTSALFDRGSKVGLASSIFGSIASLYYTLNLFTLGNLQSFGVLNIPFPGFEYDIVVSIEYSIVVYLILASGIISIVKCFVDWIGSRV